jgi:ribosome-binding factor A
MKYRNRPRRGHGHAAQSQNDLFLQALSGGAETKSCRNSARDERKTRQLCRQVERALILALAGECADELLRDLSVHSVSAMGGPSHLLIRVQVPPSQSVAVALARLSEKAGALRASIARSISRKRVPTLSFMAVVDLEGGTHE